MPTVSVGTGPAYLVIDSDGMILGQAAIWGPAHTLAHKYADGRRVDPPVRVVHTATLTYWSVSETRCYRPDPLTGQPMDHYQCPRPVESRPHTARLPRRLPRGLRSPSRLLTMPLLSQAPDERTPTEELSANLATGRALISEIEARSASLGAFATLATAEEASAVRPRLDRIMAGVAGVVADLDAIAHDT
jgi:hypothetical protein